MAVWGPVLPEHSHRWEKIAVGSEREVLPYLCLTMFYDTDRFFIVECVPSAVKAIETSSLTKRFGDVTAVDDLSFTVDEGEVFGFLGPNGAGKSTTINMLLGYMSPTAGSATVLGCDIETESRTLRSRTGVLPEDTSVYERLTAREHVEAAIRFKGVDDDPEQLLKRVGLKREAWDRAAGGFSTGMEQRLGLATALAGNPELLVLDEPQAGLDPNGMQHVRKVVLEEAASGTAVFFSSHILPEVEAVSDRVGMMRDGSMPVLNDVEALQQETGTDPSLTVTVERPAVDTEAIAGIDGVSSVSVDGRRVEAVCADQSVRASVIAALESDIGVTDFETSERSLEDVFSEVTDTDAGQTAPAQEVAK